jgi:hypothetical protein
MIWNCKIEKVVNGYVVHYSDEVERIAVFEDVVCDNEEESEQRTFANVLWFITEHFGVFNSKHNKTRLNISVDKNE